MTLSREQAQLALQDMEHMASRSATLYKYIRMSPHLLLWGCVWLVAYGLSDLWPGKTGLIWLVADSIGAAASIYIGRVQGRSIDQSGRRTGPVILTTVAFVMATFAILPPHSSKQIAAFIPLVVAAVYILLGIWHGRRLVITGVLIGMLTLLGFFMLHSHFNLWMAAVGGGALILTGIWLRRV